jgi:hypothetical protein
VVFAPVSPMGRSSTEPRPQCDVPPAASITYDSGAHSYSSRSFGGLLADAGLQKTPPPWEQVVGNAARQQLAGN